MIYSGSAVMAQKRFGDSAYFSNANCYGWQSEWCFCCCLPAPI